MRRLALLVLLWVGVFAPDAVAQLQSPTLVVSATAGGSVTTPGEGTFTYAYGTSVPVVAAADLHYHFVNWTGTAVTAGKVASPTSATTTVTMDDSYTLIANFIADELTLTTSSGDGGSVTTPGEGTFTYAYGTSVPVVATADLHYHFVNWTGTAVTAGKVASPTSATTTVTMDDSYTLIANFSADELTLTTSSGDGGSVTAPGEGTFTYAYGTSVPVVATADLHYHFVNWTGTAVTAGKVASPTSATTTVTMDDSYTLIANFSADELTLTTSSGAGGSVTTPGEGTFTYAYGTSVPVVATADLHYHFVNWTGTAVTAGKVASPTSATTTVTMDDSYTLIANFSADELTLTTSSGAGGSVTTPGEGTFTYAYGTSVPVVATADLHYHFVNWTGTAVTAGKVASPTSATTTVTMDGSYTLIANFSADELTLTTSSGDGGSVTTPGEGTFTYAYGTSVPVVATADLHYHFVNWTGTAVTAGKVASPTSATTTVTMDGSYTLIANFSADELTLTTSSGAGGSVTTPGEGTFTYAYGTSVPVVATADLHYHFVNWTGTAVTAGKVASPTSATTTVTMDGSYTLIANFSADELTLTTSSGDGGSVTTPGEGTFTYAYGTSVPVVATADLHYHFVNWTGTAVTAGKVASPTSATTTVTMDGSYTLIANFSADELTLTTSSGDGGSVTTPGEGTFTYAYGTSVPVVATADLHYHFVNWTGTAVTAGKVASPTSATTTVTMDGSYTLIANFSADELTLTTSSGAGGSVTTPGEGTFTYAYGTSVPVVATADLHYHFVNWTGTAVTAGKVASPTSATTTVTMDGSYTLIASFAPDTYTLIVNATHGCVTRNPDKPSYVHGETVLLQATPDLNYDFKGWSGDASGVANPIVVTMDSNKSVTAVFALCTAILNLSSTAGGNVTAPGEGTFEYTRGDQVMLEATADLGFVFVHWRGNLSSDKTPYLLTMDGDYTIRAVFESTSDILYVDDDAPADPGPCDMNVSDPHEAGTCDHPFDSIQEAIEVAKEGARIVIRSGTYWEIIDLLGKGLTLDGLTPNGLSCGDAGCAPLPVINGLGKGTVVTCNEDECSDVKNPHVLFRGLVITGGQGRVAGGVVGRDSSPSFENCLIVGNRATDPNDSGYIGSGSQGCVNGGACYFQDCNVVFANCTLSGNYGVAGGPVMGFKNCGVTIMDGIVWDNGPIAMVAEGPEQPVVTHTDFSGGILGVANVNVNPLFAMPGYWADPMDLSLRLDGTDRRAVWVPGDYHVQSQVGRWSTVQGWVKDQATSPCIDAGNPTVSAAREPQPNGGRINLGTYGGTCQASMSVK